MKRQDKSERKYLHHAPNTVLSLEYVFITSQSQQ